MIRAVRQRPLAFVRRSLHLISLIFIYSLTIYFLFNPHPYKAFLAARSSCIFSILLACLKCWLSAVGAPLIA